jgi:MoaA/NifB/PqqE/SkfB family radical SAM enzyme
MNLKNKFRLLSGILNYKLFNKKTPLRIVIKITQRCNLKCKHCLEWRFKNKKELSLRQIKKILVKLWDAGAVHLSLNGGEPFIRKDIKEILRFAKKLGFSIGVTSNGTFIPEKRDCLKYIDILGLSLDGPEKIHNKLRGRGQFKQVIKALKIAGKKSNVYLNTVLTKEICSDLKNIEEVVEIAARNNVGCNFVTMYGDVQGEIIEKPEDKELRKAVKKIIELKRKGGPILYSNFTYNYILDWEDYSKEKYYKEKGKLKCIAGKLAIAIDANGEVFPCNMVKNKEFEPVNILEFENIDKMMEKVSKRNKCKHCYYSCYCESNALLGLKPGVIFEYLGKLK